MSGDFNPSEYVSVPDGWTCKRLIDCTIDESISYGIVQPGHHDVNGVPIIRVNNVNNGQLNLSDVLKVSPDIEKKYQRTRLKGGEVLLTLVGSTGQSFIAPKELSGWNVPRAIAVIRVNDEVGANWINICLQSREVMNFLDVRANTTVQKTLNLKDVKDIPIIIPPKKIKGSIESLATSLSEKITLNRQINQTLEAMAQALFKSWFVDFEPVKAKLSALAVGDSADDANLAAMSAISGKTTEQLLTLKTTNPDQYQQLYTTADLFPSEMVNSELGEIPKGWEVLPLSEIIEVTGGGTPKRSEGDYWNGEINWFSVKDAPSDGDVFVIDTEEKITQLGVANSSTKILPIGTTIISARGTVGKLALVGTETAMNQSCYGVNGKEGVGAYLNYLNVKHMIIELQRNTHGAVFDTITTKTFEAVQIVNASTVVNQHFEKAVNSLFNQIKSNLFEVKSLIEIRDTLLPKLLAGELLVDGVGDE